MPLLDLPEEILFVVLESAILPSDSRLSLPEPQSLFTCRTIHRIGLPILYQSILLRSTQQALKVENTILSRPELVHHIRHLYSSAPASWLDVFRAIGNGKGSLQTLDFVFGLTLGGSGEDIWQSLSVVPVRRLVVRQGPWLLHTRASIAASALARAIESWTGLVRTFVARNDMLTLQENRKLQSSNPVRCSYLLRANRIPSRWHCPARRCCAFCALPCLRRGVRPYSLPARTPAWFASSLQRRGYPRTRAACRR